DPSVRAAGYHYSQAMPAGKWRNSIGGAVRPRLCGWIGGMCPSLTVRQVSPKLLKRFSPKYNCGAQTWTSDF
ncbi:hypothetical protein, partial [Pseudomonas aeruginosa]|uniref:hypothetical protein n=2 Tax=Pseudomonas aeruginosa TaxID=287 RepID=UPI001968F0EA